MIPKFVMIATGQYSYIKQDGNYNRNQEIGHSVYGLDEDGQIWKFVCSSGKWQWAKLEETTPEIYG